MSYKRNNFFYDVKEHMNAHQILGLPGGSGLKNLPANAGDRGSIPGLGRPHIPVGHNYGACALEPRTPSCWARGPHPLQPVCQPMPAARGALPGKSLRSARKSSPRSPKLEKAQANQCGPSAAKNK